jgi:formylglycine-generating enzyme required for sulfatase activity
LAKVATSGVFNFYGFLFIVVIVASTFAAEKSRRHLKSAREKQQAPPIHAFIAKNLAITASLLTLLTIIQCALVYAVRGPDSSSDSGAVDTAPSLAPSSGNTDPAAISTTRRTVELVARAIDIWHCKYGGGLAQHWQKVDRGDFNPGAPSPPPDLPRTDVIGEMTSNLDLILEDFLPGDLQCRMVQDEWNRNLRVLIDGDGDGRLALGGTTVEARAIVWSMGSDGIDNQGSGDDVVALLNWPQGVPPNDPAVYQTIVPPSLANAKTLLFKGPLDMPFANIGNPGNPADPATAAPGTTTGRYGTVSRDYRIAVFETTIAQYATFLNAVGATDEYGLYSTDMHTDTRIAGIIRQGQPGSFVYYVIADSEHKPITYVSWFDAARFSNWMHNGQPAGTQTAATTEDGAYTLNGLTSGLPPARKPGARFWIPDINEWHKAAYYDPTKAGTGGYWRFPMRCDTLTSNTIGATNAANYFDGDFLGSGNNYYPTANALTVVGTYGAASNSSYGTADQGGNVWEWTDGVDRTGNGSTDGLRGGSWFETDPASRMSSSSSFPTYIYPIEELARAGFRVAGAPESK